MGYGYRSSWPYVRISNMRLKWLEDDAWYSEEQCGTFPVGPASERILSTKPWTSLMLVERSGPKKWSNHAPTFRLTWDERIHEPQDYPPLTAAEWSMKSHCETQIRQHSAFSWKEMANAFNNGLGRTGNSLGCCWDGFLGKFPTDVFFHLEYGEPLEFDSPYFQAEPHVISI